MWRLVTKARALFCRSESVTVTSFFLLVGVCGFLVLDDYGISWDELRNRTNGMRVRIRGSKSA